MNDVINRNWSNVGCFIGATLEITFERRWIAYRNYFGNPIQRNVGCRITFV